MDDKAAEGSQRVEVQVLLAEEHQASLPAVIARLQEAGMGSPRSSRRSVR
jgi:hypothetical protein